MIKVLTITKSDDPSLHLNFWQENLKSDYPVIEIKKSNLKNGGLGVFATDNCIFLPKGLMYLPNVDGQPRDTPAEEGTTMSNYQFSITLEGRTKYIFPTLEHNSQLPCAQFINTPLRKTQGHYSTEVNPNCKQAMHVGNSVLLGKFPGGFRGNQVIYPGFEILGSYSSSYCLPKAEDYDRKCKDYEKQWNEETQIALQKERRWRTEITTKNQKKINYWRKFASSI